MALPALAYLAASAASAYGAHLQNKRKSALAREQMHFQERMSSTAYQRAYEDMKRAGINPMLSGRVGGASTPSGSMPDVEDALGRGVSSALEARRAYAEVNNLIQQNKKLAAETDFVRTQTEAAHYGIPQKELTGKVFGEAVHVADDVRPVVRQAYNFVKDNVKRGVSANDRMWNRIRNFFGGRK